MKYTTGELVASHTMDNNTTMLCHDKKDVLCSIRWSGRAVPESEQKANAKLFATSGAMYESLKAIMEHIRHNDPNYFKSGWYTDARETIDKAEGK
ncbi:hypothetical protein LCGC14_1821420 [marine sediment metagenome]|uniref:Uncharacterized protein n=1 Tax=marine sediment metagenome TaxID=412755 RepID=A0A0F9H6X3_9ZZZZ